jgi:hypothetical protein
MIGTRDFLPFAGIDGREKDIGPSFWERCLYVGNIELVRQINGLAINLGAPDNKDFLTTGDPGKYFCQVSARPGNYYIVAPREWLSQRFISLSSHDHGMAHGQTLEMLQVFGNVPQQSV